VDGSPEGSSAVDRVAPVGFGVGRTCAGVMVMASRQVLGSERRRGRGAERGDVVAGGAVKPSWPRGKVTLWLSCSEQGKAQRPISGKATTEE
jgi:hypothetical protein